MRRSLAKKLVVVCAVSALALSPIAAEGRRDRDGHYDDDRHYEHDYDDWHDDHDMRCMPPMFPYGDSPRADVGDTVLMGTVRSVDAEAGVISVRDADGNTTAVHINPLTRIARRLPPPEISTVTPPPQGARIRPPKIPNFESIDISGISEGDFVSVEDFNTGTETLEASHIVIFASN